MSHPLTRAWALPLVVASLLVVATALWAAAPASALTLGPPTVSEVGASDASGCPGAPCELWNTAVAGATLAAPSDGTITTVTLVPSDSALARQVVILHDLGGGDFAVTARSAPVVLASGVPATLTVNLPVAAGDLVGIEGEAPYFRFDPGSMGVFSFQGGPPAIGAPFSINGAIFGGDARWEYNAEFVPAGGNADPGNSPFPPVVTRLSASTGAAGTGVGIDGDNFDTAAAVYFADRAAQFVVDGYQHISAVAPPGLVGTVDVTVVNANGTSETVAADQFTYTDDAAQPPSTPEPAATRTAVCWKVPNLMGATYGAAKRKLKSAGCDVALRRSGHSRRGRSHVKRQTPAAGTTLFEGDSASVRLG